MGAMKNKTVLAAPLLAFFLALGACSKKPPEPARTPKQATAEQAESSAPVRTSFEEPPEDVLRKFMFKAYEDMDAAGGVPMTATASGTSGRVRMKLYEVRKTDCKLIGIPSIAPAGMFDCTVNLKVKMWWDGQREPSEPSDDNKGIFVVQDDRGNWLDCSHEAKKNREFCDARVAYERQGGK